MHSPEYEKQRRWHGCEPRVDCELRPRGQKGTEISHAEKYEERNVRKWVYYDSAIH